MSNFEVHANNILFDKKTIATLSEDIQDSLIVSGYIVILVDGKKSNNEQNVYCYDLKGNLRWRIDKVDPLHESNYYTSIYQSDNELKAYSKNGIEATINKETGSITKKELIK